MRYSALIVLVCASSLVAQTKPIPTAQTIPLPGQQISFQRDGAEIARFYFAPDQRRPFVYPIVGPAGKSLTRMGHPHDAIGHSHHNSVWISHHDVNGVSFWGDTGKGRIVHKRTELLTDGDAEAGVVSVHEWLDEAKNKVLLTERRRTQVVLLPDREWLLVIDLHFEAKEEVTLGKTPFGMIGVRMAKTIGVHDGGGRILSSAGGVNEKEIFWKPAKWVDYAGAVTPKAVEGVTLMDHPANPNHPSVFHVRDDGWMGASLTFDDARVLKVGEPLKLRYGLYVHAGMLDAKVLGARFGDFAQTPLPDLAPKMKKKS